MFFIQQFLQKVFRLIGALIKYWFFLFCANVASLFISREVNKVKLEGVRNPLLTCIGEIKCADERNTQSIIERVLAEVKGDLLLAYVEEGMSIEHNKRVLNLAGTDDFLVETESGTVGICVFHSITKLSQFAIIKRRKVLEKKGASVCIAVAKHDDEIYLKWKRAIKLIGKSGFDVVYGLHSGIGIRRNMRGFGFGDTSIFYSLGELSDGGHTNKKYEPSLIMEFSLDLDRGAVAGEWYYPAYMQEFYYGARTIVFCDTDKEGEIEHEKKVLSSLKQKMKGMHHFRDIISMQEIFDAVGVEIPEKYQYLRNYYVNSICSRTGELAPNNVFFFRPAFRDHNDDKPQSEMSRNKLVFRALMRKPLFTFSYKPLPKAIPHMVIDDTSEAHIAAIAMYRRRFRTRFIGVTGSVGKTSTKDMLFCALKEGYKTDRSKLNTNVQIRIGLNVQRLNPDTEFFIQEIGGGRPGGASRHSRMVLPDICVVTNIGTAHIGNYESQEHLMENKLAIAEGMGPEGLLFLNGDDPLLINAKTSHRTIYFAIENKEADFYADILERRENETIFNIVHKGESWPAKINVSGDYNVLNAVCSFGVCYTLGMEPEDILRGVQNFHTSGTRQNLVNLDGYRLLIDCFNASSGSIETSLSRFAKLRRTGRKIAVIGDVTGIGEMNESINSEIAALLDEYYADMDTLVLYGSNSDKIVSEMKSDDHKIIKVDDKNKIEEWMRSEIKRGDLVLFKGSSKTRMDESIDDVYGTIFADGKFIEESHFFLYRKKEVVYRVFKDYVTIIRSAAAEGSIKIKNKVAKRPVKKIATKAFMSDKMLTGLTVGDNLLHIGSAAFANCGNLKTFTHKESIIFMGKACFKNCARLERASLPASLKFLGAEAFKGCKSIRNVVFPGTCNTVSRNVFEGCVKLESVKFEEGVNSIGREAFAYCKSLKEVEIPDSVKSIRSRAFARCTSLKTIRIPRGTKVAKDAFVGCKNIRIERV